MAQERPQLIIADHKGKIYSLPFLEATAMKAGHCLRLQPAGLVRLPAGSELFMLPQRVPVGYHPQQRKMVVLEQNPFSRSRQRCFAVAAFVSPGYSVTYNCAYKELHRPAMLPMFSYAAVAFYRGEFYATCLRVDREQRQDLRYMDINLVRKNAQKLNRIFGQNRLIKHLQNCALVYGCPAAKNFFLSRYEAPLPTSPGCNAQCWGCISYQPKKQCPVTQPRIKFVPRPEEIAEVALWHLSRVRDPLVSFGQGCEGEPLLVGRIIEKTIKIIRKKTSKGIININTNASKPQVIARLFDAGLNSIRVSLNSLRSSYYSRYFRPKSYSFNDVLSSIKIAKKKQGFVSVNYLTMPGFTDSPDEVGACKDFITAYRIDMIQWRNLNFDPLHYFRKLKFRTDPDRLLGIDNLIRLIKRSFPQVMNGYFNPARLRIKRHQGPGG